MVHGNRESAMLAHVCSKTTNCSANFQSILNPGKGVNRIGASIVQYSVELANQQTVLGLEGYIRRKTCLSMLFWDFHFRFSQERGAHAFQNG